VLVRTLFFAAYRDALGTSSLEVDLPSGATVSDLVRTLRERGGGFVRLPDEPTVAVNRSYVGRDLELTAGDEVAFIPPVAGG
jgi:molybdopterin converting factor subunit 1